MVEMEEQVSNWGKYPVIDARVVSGAELGNSASAAAPWNSSTKASTEDFASKPWIARGLGRCYGDSSLAPNIVQMVDQNRFLSFDTRTGILVGQAGLSLAEILHYLLPRGYFPPVTPGTKFVTLGGAVASDVHGKNHHKEGSFCKHVLWIDLLTPSGKVLRCSNKENREIFQATCGGMGHTGIILNVSLKLKKIESAYIVQKSIRARNLREIMDLFEEHESYTYSMAWLDCLSRGASGGRSIMMAGEHATLHDLKATRYIERPLQPPEKRKLNVPLNFPTWALNSFSVRAFNFLYYHKHGPREKNRIIDYDSFFYPLDAIHNWNRIYGRRGFTQYQFVLPLNSSYEGIVKILDVISRSGKGSFLSVLKLFGKQKDLISFPMEGYTLALDFAIDAEVFSLLNELDAIVDDFGGRLYMAKDVRMTSEFFMKTYPNAKKFIALRKKYDKNGKFLSLQGDRLGF